MCGESCGYMHLGLCNLNPSKSSGYLQHHKSGASNTSPGYKHYLAPGSSFLDGSLSVSIVVPKATVWLPALLHNKVNLKGTSSFLGRTITNLLMAPTSACTTTLEMPAQCSHQITMAPTH